MRNPRAHFRARVVGRAWWLGPDEQPEEAMSLSPTMTIYQRQAVIAEALARVLDRSPALSVESIGPSVGDVGIFVLAKPFSDERQCFAIEDIARELEALL